ncbi:MAG: hypothetical protein ACFFE8_01430 [Candidatus Heimdallarchaeota archaeon]
MSLSKHDRFDTLIPTHEVGSMRKLNATIFALQGRDIPTEHIEELQYWWPLLNLGDPDEAISLLQGRPSSKDDLPEWELEVLKLRLRFNVRFLENTGLDYIFTGEAWRREMYEHVAKDINGIYLEQEHVRSFDDRFYKPGVRVKDTEVRRKNSIYKDEFEFAKTVAKQPLRFCFTGPYTTFNWTIKASNDYQFLFDLVDDVFVPEVKEIVKAGARYVTADEPAYTTIPGDREIYLEAYERFFRGIRRTVSDHGTRVGFHTCFSDSYDVLFSDIPKLPWDYASLEYANRDLKINGTTSKERPSFKKGVQSVVEAFNQGSRCKYALGILEVHADRHYTKEDIQNGAALRQISELTRDRLLYQVRALYDQLGEDGPFLVMSAPDCGLRPVNNLANLHMMLSAMCRGTKEARTVLQTELDLPDSNII